MPIEYSSEEAIDRRTAGHCTHSTFRSTPPVAVLVLLLLDYHRQQEWVSRVRTVPPWSQLSFSLIIHDTHHMYVHVCVCHAFLDAHPPHTQPPCTLFSFLSSLFSFLFSLFSFSFLFIHLLSSFLLVLLLSFLLYTYSFTYSWYPLLIPTPNTYS